MDVAEIVDEAAPMEEGSWRAVRRQDRRKKNFKITGTLLPGNGSLMGVERPFVLYLGEFAIQTSEIDVFSHIRDQCNIETKREALQCSSCYFKAFKITVKASEKEKLLSASIWLGGVFINKLF